jgi:hypothetical protein
MSKNNEKKKSYICCLCNETVHTEAAYGNNPYPLAAQTNYETMSPRCCDYCNSTKVIPARLGISTIQETKDYYSHGFLQYSKTHLT